MGVDEWEETRLVLLGGLFGTSTWAQLTEGAGRERHRVRKIHTISAIGITTLVPRFRWRSPHTRVKVAA